MPVPILLDTDIGSSFDDTICLAYILGSEELELVGISTVSGQSHRRARYAGSILRHYGIDVPVVAGVEAALTGELMQPETVAGLPLVPRGAIAGSGPRDLQDLYSQSLECYGDRLVILSIGPLTNLAHLSWSDSDGNDPQRMPRLVAMGGSVSGEREWNVLLDPEAADGILGSPGATPGAFSRRTLLPIEITRRLTMTASEAARRIPRHLTEPFGDLSRHPRHPGSVVLHDPLAALAVTQEEHCVFEHGFVEIALNSSVMAGSSPGRPRGSCLFVPPSERDGGDDFVSVAVDVDRDSALNAILATLC